MAEMMYRNLNYHPKCKPRNANTFASSVGIQARILDKYLNTCYSLISSLNYEFRQFLPHKNPVIKSHGKAWKNDTKSFWKEIMANITKIGITKEITKLTASFTETDSGLATKIEPVSCYEADNKYLLVILDKSIYSTSRNGVRMGGMERCSGIQIRDLKTKEVILGDTWPRTPYRQHRYDPFFDCPHTEILEILDVELERIKRNPFHTHLFNVKVKSADEKDPFCTHFIFMK